MAFGLETLGADLVCSIVDPENEASIRVAARVHQSQHTFVNAKGKTRNLYWTEASDR